MPQRELERLQAVNRFMNLEIHKDANLQEIVELVSELCETPIALINLAGEDTRYFTFATGINSRALLSTDTFWPAFSESEEIVVVPDASADKRFAQFPLVAGYPHIRFYAGAPLTTHDGLQLGSICIMDLKPRQLTPAQQHLLKVLSHRVIQFIEFESTLGILKKQFLQAKDAEIKLRSFFESSVACHLLLGLKEDVLTYNRNMAVLLERMYSVRLTFGMSVGEVLQGEALKTFVSEYRQALNGNTLRFEREVIYRTGETIWWDVTFEPAFDPSGEIIGASYNATDITERKLYEKRILSQNESLKRIAFIQSHELRKPVASILGLINVIKMEDHLVSVEVVEMLRSAATELDDKIRSIVHFAE